MGLYDVSEKALQLESQGRKVAKLYVAEPETETPAEIVEAAYAAMKRGETKYVSGAGIPRLRKAIADFHGCRPSQVTVGPGVKWFIGAVMRLLCKPGDNIVMPTPHYPPYQLNCENIGLEFRGVSSRVENNWQVTAEEVEKKMDGATRLLALVNPMNPTSTVIDPSEFKRILAVAEKRKVHVLLDEVYRDLAFDGRPGSLDPKNPLHIVLNGFSKTFAMTGWRAGYCISSEDIAKQLLKYNNVTISCVPPFVQEACLASFAIREREGKKMRTEYKKRADAAVKVFTGSKKIKFAPPQSGFTIFLQVNGLDSEKFCGALLEKTGIGIGPGSSFGFPDCVRVALTQPVKELEKNLLTIRQELEKA